MNYKTLYAITPFFNYNFFANGFYRFIANTICRENEARHAGHRPDAVCHAGRRTGPGIASLRAEFTLKLLGKVTL